MNGGVVIHFIYLHVNGVRDLAVHDLPKILSEVSRDIPDNHYGFRSHRNSKSVLVILVIEHEIETAARFQSFYPLL